MVRSLLVCRWFAGTGPLFPLLRPGKKENRANTYDFGRIFVDETELPAVLQQLAESWEGKGDRVKALEYYGRLVDLWRDADPEMQSAVRRAKDRIAELAREH